MKLRASFRPEVGLHEVRPLVVELQQRLLILGEPEEVVLLLDPLRDRVVLGALPVHELFLALERLAAHAVEPRIRVLVDVAVVVDPLDEVLHEGLVPLVRRADEEVDGGVDLLRNLAPLLGDLVDVHLGVEPFLFGDSVDLRPVLVRAGEEERVLASLPVMAHEDVRRERRVGMPDVRRRVHVVDRCRQVEASWASMIGVGLAATGAAAGASGTLRRSEQQARQSEQRRDGERPRRTGIPSRCRLERRPPGRICRSGSGQRGYGRTHGRAGPRTGRGALADGARRRRTPADRTCSVERRGPRLVRPGGSTRGLGSSHAVHLRSARRATLAPRSRPRRRRRTGGCSPAHDLVRRQRLGRRWIGGHGRRLYGQVPRARAPPQPTERPGAGAAASTDPRSRADRRHAGCRAGRAEPRKARRRRSSRRSRPPPRRRRPRP